jgi:hypothetical protein
LEDHDRGHHVRRHRGTPTPGGEQVLELLRIIEFCSSWLRWSVPSRAKYLKALKWHSMRFKNDALVGT